MAVEFEIVVDNTDKVLQELDRRVQAALEACGQNAVSHAKSNITEAGRVDTGAMRNSINHQVKDETCYIGTNISYAIYSEYGTGIYADGGKGRKTGWYYVDARGEGHFTRGMKPIHFLKNAVANHIREYKAIMEQYLNK